ncbi:Peptidase aspartic catalytic [Penicillium expansum]|nr:Peptidase aspartic catalytic [Penicillium expansum]
MAGALVPFVAPIKPPQQAAAQPTRPAEAAASPVGVAHQPTAGPVGNQMWPAPQYNHKATNTVLRHGERGNSPGALFLLSFVVLVSCCLTV